MNVVIIKYNAGNTKSVSFALERLGIEPVISDDREIISSADKVIFPGVGQASTAMAYLREKQLDKTIISLKQPVLGICLGMQLLCNRSEEGDTDCLGIIAEDIIKFKGELKVPQVGWNNITDLQTPLFKNIEDRSFFYFVHSYYLPICSSTISTTDYIVPFSSAVKKNNFYGVQFHPEKSGISGEQLIKNFIECHD
ncbi:MAG: imidazole glycerol phosphate synthase subunit HisH [Bacteroidetes bacterium]|nr:imidazole glycerol phosphate synthase subunit HisH [Bacteroidota bacterium]